MIGRENYRVLKTNTDQTEPEVLEQLKTTRNGSGHVWEVTSWKTKSGMEEAKAGWGP